MLEFMKDENMKFSKESAREMFDKFLERFRIEIDDIEDNQVKSLIKSNMPRIIKAIRRGDLVFSEVEGKYTITLNRVDGKTALDFNVPGAVAKKAMGEKLTTDFYGRIYAMMGSACGMGESAIDKLDPVDLSIVEVLGSIFLSI
jgi:hypothetical protein